MTAYYNRGPYGAQHYSAGWVYDCSGTFAINFTLAGSFWQNLQGHFAITMSLAGQARGSWSLKGELAIVPTFFGDATAGPLWAPDAPCPPPLWGPSPPCPPPLWGADSDVSDADVWTPSELCDG